MLLRRHRWSLLRYSSVFNSIEEAAKKNMRWIEEHLDEVTRWLKRDVAEFILDDQVMHGNGTLSGIGNGTGDEEDPGSLEIRGVEGYGEIGVFSGRLKVQSIHSATRSDLGKVEEEKAASDAVVNRSESREYDEHYKEIAETKADVDGSTVMVSVGSSKDVAVSTGESISRTDSRDAALASRGYGVATNVTVNTSAEFTESDTPKKVPAEDHGPGSGYPLSPPDRPQDIEDRIDIRENAGSAKENGNAYVDDDRTSLMSRFDPTSHISWTPEKSPNAVIQHSPKVFLAAGNGSTLAGHSHVLAYGVSRNISSGFLGNTKHADGGEGILIDVWANAKGSYPLTNGHSDADNEIPVEGSTASDVNDVNPGGGHHKSHQGAGTDTEKTANVSRAGYVAVSTRATEVEPENIRKATKAIASSSLAKIDAAAIGSTEVISSISKDKGTEDTGAAEETSMSLKAGMASEGSGIASSYSSRPEHRRSGVESEEASNDYSFEDDYLESGDIEYAVNEGSGQGAVMTLR